MIYRYCCFQPFICQWHYGNLRWCCWKSRLSIHSNRSTAFWHNRICTNFSLGKLFYKESFIITNFLQKLCSTLWLERSIADSRLKFLRDVLTVAKNSHLVLMFPEGYCSNGTRVLQFRKAVFEKHIKIYPIAISVSQILMNFTNCFFSKIQGLETHSGKKTTLPNICFDCYAILPQFTMFTICRHKKDMMMNRRKHLQVLFEFWINFFLLKVRKF